MDLKTAIDSTSHICEEWSTAWSSTISLQHEAGHELDLCLQEVQADLEALADREHQFKEKLSTIQHSLTTHVTECLHAIQHLSSTAEALNGSLGHHFDTLKAHLHETGEQIAHDSAELRTDTDAIQHKQTDLSGFVDNYTGNLSRMSVEVRHHIESDMLHVNDLARQEIATAGHDLEHSITAESIQTIAESTHMAADAIGRLAEQSEAHARQLLTSTSTSMQEALMRLNTDATARFEEITHTVSTLSQTITSLQTRITSLIADLHRAGEDVELGVSTVNTGLETALGILDELQHLFSRFG